MQYLLLIYQPHLDAEPTPGEWAAMMAAYVPYRQMLEERGVFRDGAPLAGVETATTVRARESGQLVTDGPFAKTKEWLGGFITIECATLDAAVAYTAACPGARNGSIEVRPLAAAGP